MKAAHGGMARGGMDFEVNARPLRGPVTVEEGGHKWVLQPEGRFMMKWDVLGVCLLMWTVTIVPLKFGFDVIDLCPEPMWILDVIIDTYFMCDLCLNFVTATYVLDPTTNDEILSRKLDVIAHKYLRGWFTIDLLSSLPIHPILSVTFNGCDGGNGGDRSPTSGASLIKLVRILRLVKLLKILRVLKLKQRLEELTDSIAVSIDLGCVRPARASRPAH